MIFDSIGRLIYFNNPYKLIVEIDSEISRYYLSLIPKYIQLNKPKFAPHISVVRKEMPNLLYWGKYENQFIDFQYENIIYNDELYYWLNIYSPKLEEIRLELGLTNASGITRAPNGRHRFHTTLGNVKYN